MFSRRMPQSKRAVTICSVLSRIWLVSQRGELNDDPTIFAAKDRLCQLLALALVLSLLAARFA